MPVKRSRDRIEFSEELDGRVVLFSAALFPELAEQAGCRENSLAVALFYRGLHRLAGFGDQALAGYQAHGPHDTIGRAFSQALRDGSRGRCRAREAIRSGAVPRVKHLARVPIVPASLFICIASHHDASEASHHEILLRSSLSCRFTIDKLIGLLWLRLRAAKPDNPERIPPMIANRHTLANALRIAAKAYNDSSHRVSCIPGHDRMEKAFVNQEREALALADEIEQADSIRLED